jgi:hypothetical protein
MKPQLHQVARVIRMGERIDELFFRKGNRDGIIVLFWGVFALMIFAWIYTFVVAIPEHDLEKAKLKSMSCTDLGQWIIDNSNKGSGRGVDSNYAYAEARYLVCTHTPGASP